MRIQWISLESHPVRLLPHLGAVLCSAARLPGEPRRALVVEAVAALRALADSPEEGYGPQAATISTIVARLLSASMADRKEEKEGEDELEASPKRKQRRRSFFLATEVQAGDVEH